jgi:F1F0 ATPase subunit 2
MNDAPALMLAGVAGVALGLLFFGGLWWTVRRAFASSNPALWFGASALLRMGLVTAGFVVVSAGHWQRLMLCLIGFWLARWLVQRLTAMPDAASVSRPDADNGPSIRPPSSITQERTP